jgi:hypothetical protein
MDNERRRAKLHILLIKTFLKILIISLIATGLTTIIDDIFLLPKFISFLYVVFIAGIILSLVVIFIVIICISSDLDFSYTGSSYKDEIYNSIFHDNDNNDY